MEVLMRRFRDTLAADVPPLGTAADEGVSGGPQQQAVSNYMQCICMPSSSFVRLMHQSGLQGCLRESCQAHCC